MNKIAVVSDIHGNIAALEKVAADIRARNVTQVFNLGDHVSGPLWPHETVQFLMAQNWIHIAGNHERTLTRQDPAAQGPSDSYARQQLQPNELDWLRSLPASWEIGAEFLLIHGTPARDNSLFLESVQNGRSRMATRGEILTRLGDAKHACILCGHTHTARLVEIRAGQIILNPGSVGLQAYEDNDPEPYVMENASPHARYALLEYTDGAWQAEFILLPYDHDSAARQARQNKRPDWAVALQTGFMQADAQY